jgi:heme exporter protein D
MINELILMNGYGSYVWSAFIFTFVCFAALYFIIRLKLLKEQSKFASKFSSLDEEKTRVARLQKINKEILLNTSKI